MLRRFDFFGALNRILLHQIEFAPRDYQDLDTVLKPIMANYLYVLKEIGLHSRIPRFTRDAEVLSGALFRKFRWTEDRDLNVEEF